MTLAMKRILATLLTVAFLVLAGWFLWHRREEFTALDWPSPAVITIVAFAFIINLILRSAYNFFTVRHLGTWVSPIETFMLSTVATAGNFLVPGRAGAGFRALYMKSVYGFPLTSMASSMLLFIVINIIIVSVAAILLILIFGGRKSIDMQLLIFFPVLTTLMIVFLLVLRSRRSGDNAKSRIWHSAFRGSLGHMMDEKCLMAIATTVVALNFLVSSFAWMVALREYASTISASDAFLLSASQIISGVITITPGAAGFQELAGLYVGRSLPITVVELFAVLLWVRVVRTLVAVLLAMPSILLLRRRMIRGVPSKLGEAPTSQGNHP